MVHRLLLGIIALCIGGIGSISPDTDHFLSLVTGGKTELGMFHSLVYIKFFAWLAGSCLAGLIAICFLKRFNHVETKQG